MARTTTVRHELPLRVRLIKDIRKNYPLYLLALPAIVMIFLLSYVPMYGVLMAFQDFRPVRGILGSDWVGLENFRRFFNSYQCADIISNTVTLSLMNLVCTFPMPILLALMLNQIHRPMIKKGIQTLVYLPHFIATVVLVSMINVLF
ncbi:MAG: hypothetical protein UD963_03970, partial [Christensenellales bacterium]|nr:hypothetical protein [Christensenellales bacterium]